MSTALYPSKAANLRAACGQVNDLGDVFDDMMRGANSAMSLVSLNIAPHATLNDVQTHVGMTRSGVALFRAGVTWLEVLGGSLQETLSLGKFMSLVIKTLLVVGRTLSALLWAHRKSPFLGEHAKSMGVAASCIYTAVNGVSFVKAVKDYYAPHLQLDSYRAAKLSTLPGERMEANAIATAYALRRREQAKIHCLSTFLELACSPWECGLFHSNSYASAMIGSVLNLVSSGLKLFTHWNYFDLASDTPPEPATRGPTAATLSY